MTTHNRGSEWKRWDLHVHSPASYLNNGFGDPALVATWDNYVKDLFKKALEKEIAAIGITDYFSVEGYEKVLGYQTNPTKLEELGFSNEQIHEIQKILLLPNVELRLKCFAGNTNRVNFHVIFSNEVDLQDIKENFLENLDFVNEGNPQSRDYLQKLKKYNLEQLGNRLKREQPEFTGTDLFVGAMNAVVDDKQVTDILDTNSRFKNKYLVCTPVDEDLSRLSWVGQDHQTRKVLYQKSNCFFTSNKQTIEFGLGKKHPTIKSFISEFISLKPCIHGSDAHSSAKLFEPDENRFCWIKAEPTFSGLRQILFDPEERVSIGEIPPSERKNLADIISQISIQDPIGWFTNRELYFNKGLVSIIGQKGSGKTALADLLAYCTGTWDKADKGRYSNSFLKKAEGKLIGTNLAVKYGNERNVHSTISRDYEPQIPPAIQYLSQQFVTALCEDVETSSLLSEIENVIFTYISEEDRLQTTSFKDLKEKRLVAIQAKRSALVSKIQQANDRLSFLYKLRDKEIAEKNAIKAKNSVELKGLKDSLPQATTEAEKRNIELLSRKTELLKAERAKIENINVKLSKLDELESVLISADQYLEQVRDHILTEFTELEFSSDEINKIIPVSNAGFKIVIASARKKLGDEKQTYAKPDSTYQMLSKEVEELKKKVIDDKTKQIKYQESIDKIAKLEKHNAGILVEIEKMQKAILEIDPLKAQRTTDFIELIRTLKDEQVVYLDLYKPLQQRILSGTDTEKLLNFNIRYLAKTTNWKDAARILVNKRGRNIFDDGSEFDSKLNEYQSLLTSDEFVESELMGEETENKFKSLIGNIVSTMEAPDTMPSFNSDYSIKDLWDWFFDINYMQVSFGIQFENVSIERLSPGTRGIVLLLIYLGIDVDDTRPLIIDQPEDNLDNTSVYNILVPYFRQAKMRRQIFLITHNANLVINTDSEQVIIATMERNSDTSPIISYEVKSLEGGKSEICEILEGGTEAFKMREDKYDLV